MSGALRWISIGLTKELDKIREDAVHSLPIAIANTEVKPYYNSTLEHLQDLSAVIDHRGTPLVTTYSRDEPQVRYRSGFSASNASPCLLFHVAIAGTEVKHTTTAS